ncbi:MAG: YabP/YqfC family sporulation protein [Ruminococcus sp.]|nr:YabP/YqfC family sporulation protein [Ruminococcus sp.]MDE7225850.1 YabP/YqfC family sporulation protein [Ruminococcus sp.]
MFDNLTNSVQRAFFLETVFHVSGNRELIIENCNKILECSDVFMSLSSTSLVVQIWGSELRAFDYKTKGLVIRGKISHIELVERGKKHEKSAEGLYKD